MRVFNFVILILFLFGCKKQDVFEIINDSNYFSLEGKWVNLELKNDTLFFNKTQLERIHQESLNYDHLYNYEIHSDTLILNYMGRDKIGFIKSFRNLIIQNKTKDTLRLKSFENTYPNMRGDIFVKVK